MQQKWRRLLLHDGLRDAAEHVLRRRRVVDGRELWLKMSRIQHCSKTHLASHLLQIAAARLLLHAHPRLADLLLRARADRRLAQSGRGAVGRVGRRRTRRGQTHGVVRGRLARNRLQSESFI